MVHPLPTGPLRQALRLASSSLLSSPSSSASTSSIPPAITSNSLKYQKSASASVSPFHSDLSHAIHTSANLSSAWPTTMSLDDSNDETASAASSSSSSTSTIGGSQERRSARLQQSAPIDRTDAGTSRGTRGKLAMPRSTGAKSLLHLGEMKKSGVPIACLTAYDYPTALSLRRSDVDICLVGDSLANVALGHASTQNLTLDATVHHCQAVYRGLFSPVLSVSPDIPGAPLLIADLPFGSFHTSVEQGVESAVRLLKEGGADGVKIEGGKEILPLVRRLTQFGIPVMGHLGLQPQRVASTAGYRLQGRTADEAMQMFEDALALEDAGAFSIVLECIPNRVGETISKRLNITTIGIGAGPFCDGQILVTNDLLGELTSPWHVVVGLESPSSSSSNLEDEREADDSLVGGNIQLPRLHPSAPKGPKFVRNFAEEAIRSLSAASRTKTGELDSLPPSTSATSSPHPAPAPALNPVTSPTSSSSSSPPSPPSPSPPSASTGTFGLGALRLSAIESYVRAVRLGTFPDAQREGYKIRSEELRGFLQRSGEVIERRERRRQRERERQRRMEGGGE